MKGAFVLEFVFLGLVVLALGVQFFANKAYGLRVTGGAFTFSSTSTLVALLFFLISSGGNLCFNTVFLGYSFLFALFYAMTMVSIFFAIKTGPMSISSLMESFSLIIPTLYGLIFMGDPVGPLLVTGLLILAVSIVLVNFEKKEEKKIKPIWFLYIGMTFFGNGMCSVVQKMQQDNCLGAYKNEFMIVALFAVFAVLSIFALIFERKEILPAMKYALPFGGLCGFGNGIANLCVMLLVTMKMPASVMFPTISAGGIIVSYLLARLIYKEKLNRLQDVGVFLGIVAVILLNL